MNEWGYDDNDNSQSGENFSTPKELRDAYKKQGEKLDQALSFIEEMKTREQKRELSSVFESLGVPQAASVYQGEADPEKAKAWVESMRGVFGGTPAAQAAEPVQSAVSDDQQAALQRMTEAGQSGTPMGSFEAAQAGVGGADDLSSLLAAMKNLNMGG